MAAEKKTSTEKNEAVESEETIEQPKEEKMAEKTYTQSEVEAIVAAAIAKLQKEATATKTNEEYVTLVYMGVVAENSTILLGTENNRGLGEIQGRGGIRTVRKSDFVEKMNPQIAKRLKDRRLVVVSGLSDEEREEYGVKYEEGELLSRDIYRKLFNLTDDKILEIFKSACYQHKKIIATLFIDEYVKGNNKINQGLVEKLNDVSKSADPDGMFTPILKDMYRDLSDKASKK